jgi:hypothetical protein
VSEGASAYAYNDAVRRVQELENLNSRLAEQVDRMRVVIDAARQGAQSAARRGDWQLYDVVFAYDEQMAQLASGPHNLEHPSSPEPVEIRQNSNRGEPG